MPPRSSTTVSGLVRCGVPRSSAPLRGALLLCALLPCAVHTDTLPPATRHRQGHRTVIPGPLDPILTPAGRAGPRNVAYRNAQLAYRNAGLAPHSGASPASVHASPAFVHVNLAFVHASSALGARAAGVSRSPGRR